MKYTIIEQLYILPLNHNMNRCKIEEAEYQFEVYKAQEARLNIGVINKFNANRFTHSVNTKISLTPKPIVNNVMIGAQPKRR